VVAASTAVDGGGEMVGCGSGDGGSITSGGIEATGAPGTYAQACAAPVAAEAIAVAGVEGASDGVGANDATSEAVEPAEVAVEGGGDGVADDPQAPRSASRMPSATTDRRTGRTESAGRGRMVDTVVRNDAPR
jgi:hypothetical protein